MLVYKSPTATTAPITTAVITRLSPAIQQRAIYRVPVPAKRGAMRCSVATVALMSSCHCFQHDLDLKLTLRLATGR